MTLPLEGRRILFAVPAVRFDEAQLFQTWQLLSELGAWLVLGADSPTGVAVGNTGNAAKIGRALAEADPANFDAILFIKGEWEKGDVQAIAGRFSGVLVAAFRGVHVKADVVGSIASLDRFIAEIVVALARRPMRTSQDAAQM